MTKKGLATGSGIDEAFPDKGITAAMIQAAILKKSGNGVNVKVTNYPWVNRFLDNGRG
jgi:hypothetical protein